MKKAVSIALVIVMIASALSLFTSCDKLTGNVAGGDAEKTSEKTIDAATTEEVTTEAPPLKYTGFDEYFVSSDGAVQRFSEGKLIYTVNQKLLRCIDINGNILYEIETDGTVGAVAPYKNGVAVFGSMTRDRFLYDESGKKITADAVGGTTFVVHTDMFEDGYIFVKKEISDVAPDKTTYAVVDSKLNIIVDFSRELAELYDKYVYSRKNVLYCDGHIIRAEADYAKNVVYSALNIKTGKETAEYTNIKTLCDSEGIKYEHESDLWKPVENGYCYIGDPKETLVLELEVSIDGGNYIGKFHDGVALFKYLEHDQNGEAVNYCTLIDEQGNRLIEPIKLFGYMVENGYDNGKFIVSSRHVKLPEYHLTVFDKNGEVIEKKVEPHKDQAHVASMKIKIGDGLIVALTHEYRGDGKVKWQILCFDHQLNKL